MPAESGRVLDHITCCMFHCNQNDYECMCQQKIFRHRGIFNTLTVLGFPVPFCGSFTVKDTAQLLFFLNG